MVDAPGARNNSALEEAWLKQVEYAHGHSAGSYPSIM